MEIKNLSQLKKALEVGTRFKIVEHNIRPDWTGQIRVVQKKQGNGIYSGIADEPNHELSQKNGGRGLWLPWLKADKWRFESGKCIALEQTNDNAAFILEVM